MSTPEPTLPKPLSYWFLQLALVILLLSAGWLATVGWHIAGNSRQFETLSVVAPSFEQYLGTLGLKPPAPVKKAENKAANPATDITKFNVRVALNKVFEQVAQFENARAEPAFKKIDPVVAEIAVGSAAEKAEFKVGDVLQNLSGYKVSTVWDLYTEFNDKPASMVEIEVMRNKKVSKLTLKSLSNSSLDLNTCGLLFNIPKGYNYVSTREIPQLAEQFRTRFVETVPADWRVMYLNNLALFSQGLLGLVSDQQGHKPADASFLRTDQMLLWHHEKFMQAIDKYQSDFRQAGVSQAGQLGAFGEAITGVCAALVLLMVAFAVHLRYLNLSRKEWIA